MKKSFEPVSDFWHYALNPTNKPNKQWPMITNVNFQPIIRHYWHISLVLVLAVISEQFLKSQNSLLIGNASLAFGHIVLHPSARTFFQKSIGIERIIRQLLKLVEESWLSKPARKNVAIFLTKLVKVDERYEIPPRLSHCIITPFSFSFLQEFRNQHGTEILHSALKDVDL